MKKIIYAALVAFSLIAINACTEEEVGPSPTELKSAGGGSPIADKGM